MKSYSAVIAAAIGAIGLTASAFTSASAGVVISQTQTIVSGQPQEARQETLMIEGNKQKTILPGDREIITDLDKGTMDLIDSKQKMYFERPFPIPGMMSAGLGGPAMHASQFKKTGNTRSVAGYKCDDYNGAGKFPMGEFTVVYCVSSTAPGAAAYSKFQKTMMSKLKDTPFALPSNTPDGIPLVQDVTTKVTLPQFADRPPMVSKTEVTKVQEQKIAASEFEVPAGFTKRVGPVGRPGMGMGGPGMMGGGKAPGAPAAGASPAAQP